MEILYKQPENDCNTSLFRFGVQSCYLKKLLLKHDNSNVTKKVHYHAGFEMHIVTQGQQEYQVADKVYTIEAGNFLLIYPNIPHKVISSSEQAQKFSITFRKHASQQVPCFLGSVSPRMADDLRFIATENESRKETSGLLIENCIMEILVISFRLSGLKEGIQLQQQDDNAILSMAKQYIADNIDMAPTLENVAEYCYMSRKQLTRIFNRYEGPTPGEYIMRLRMTRAEQLLLDDTLSLKQISEKLHFSSEYYFNTALKKHLGMPPGEYRKMHGK